MNESQQDLSVSAEASAPPTQAQLYDDLRRIGQLEDQKQAIQQEIDERTTRLRQAIPTLANDSLLFKMLSSSLTQPTAKARSAKKVSSPRTRSTKKSSKKSG